MAWSVYIRRLTLGWVVLLSASLRAQSLETLEAIVNRYPTLDAFLSDSSATLEYREALKKYMGQGASFDPVYETFLAQIKDASKSIPGFADAAWKKNFRWQDQSFFLEGSIKGSGLEIKRERMLQLINELASDAQRAMVSLSKAKNESEMLDRFRQMLKNIKRTSDEIRIIHQESGVLSAEQYSALNSKQKAQYNAEMGKKKVFEILKAKNAEIKAQSAELSAVLVYFLLKFNDDLRTRLVSDADIAKAELEKIKKPGLYADFFESKGQAIPHEILPYLEVHLPTIEKFDQAFKSGELEIKRFQSIADPRLDTDIIESLALHDQPEKLTAEQKPRYDHWLHEAQKTQMLKTKMADDFASQNPFFYYDLIKDEKRKTLRLKTQGGTKIYYRPTPRPFHAFFAGTKKAECVGGSSCEGLTPRRWARAALADARTEFVEFEGGKMEGYLGLTPIVNHATGERWDTVDMLSHATKGDVVVQQNGDSAKYSFFDLWLEHEKPSPGSKGLVISNGDAISQNVTGSEVIMQSPAYREQRLVGQPKNFSPVDPMADKIANRYQAGQYPGGMIYSGMVIDGSHVFELVKEKDRRKWTLDILEPNIAALMVLGDSLPDGHLVWKLAKDNKLRLQSLEYYKNFSKLSPELRARSMRVLRELIGVTNSDKFVWQQYEALAKNLSRLILEDNPDAIELVSEVLHQPEKFKAHLVEALKTQISSDAQVYPEKYRDLLIRLFVNQTPGKSSESLVWAAHGLGNLAISGDQIATDFLVAPLREPSRSWEKRQRESSALETARLILAGKTTLKPLLMEPHQKAAQDFYAYQGMLSTYKGLAELSIHGDVQARDTILAASFYSKDNTKEHYEVAEALKVMVLQAGDGASLRKLEASQVQKESGAIVWSVKNALQEIQSNFLSNFNQASLKQKKAMLQLIKQNLDSSVVQEILSKAKSDLPIEILKIANSREARKALRSIRSRSLPNSCLRLIQQLSLSLQQ